MPTYKSLTAAGLALAAVVTLAGCAADPAPPQTAAASSTAAPASRDGNDSAVNRYLYAQHQEMLRSWEANAAVGLPITADRGLAEAAAQDGAPFAVSDPTPGLPDLTCAWIRMPNGSLWSLTGGASALTRDTVAETWLRRRGAPAPKCGGPTVTTARFDAAADAAAIKAGAPYRWTDGCKQYMHIPGSSTRFWIPDLPPEKGHALSAMEHLYACASKTMPNQGGN
jgi:hypothetical protein